MTITKTLKTKIDKVIEYNGIKTFAANVDTLVLFNFNTEDVEVLHNHGLINNLTFLRFLTKRDS